jgi:50S ribosomal subunit-associated GTPase HflX
LEGHKRQIEEQMADLQANLEEIKAHEKEARSLLTKAEKRVPA